MNLPLDIMSANIFPCLLQIPVMSYFFIKKQNPKATLLKASCYPTPFLFFSLLLLTGVYSEFGVCPPQPGLCSVLFVKPSNSVGMCLNHQMISIWKKTEYLRRGQQLKRERASLPAPQLLFILNSKIINPLPWIYNLTLPPCLIANSNLCHLELPGSSGPFM